jgi:glycosyltransferase involved in cell wall biosynthesis
LRVCQVIDRLRGGGQERVAAQLAVGLRDYVDLTALAATRSGGDYEGMLAGRDVATFVGTRRSRWDVQTWLAMGRWLRKNQIEVLHTHSPGSLRAAIHLSRLFRLRAPIVSHIQMLPPPGAFRDTAVRWHIASRPDVAWSLVTNEELRDYLVHRCGYDARRVEVLANPVSFAEWDQSAPVHEERDPTVVMLAQWRPQKDHATAISAAARVRDMGIPARWVFVGEEDEELCRAARQQIADEGLADRVSIAGRRTDIPSLLRDADVGVLATRFEGMPVAMVEYAAAGLPSVVSSVEGTRDWIARHDGIIGVPPEDPVALASAVSSLLKDKGRRDALGEIARTQMKAVADLPVVLERVLHVYGRVSS